MENSVNTVPYLPNHFMVDIGRPHFCLEFLILCFERLYFCHKLWPVIGVQPIRFQVPNRLVELFQFLFVLLGIFLSGCFEASFGFVSNRFQAGADGDIYDD